MFAGEWGRKEGELVFNENKGAVSQGSVDCAQQCEYT